MREVLQKVSDGCMVLDMKSYHCIESTWEYESEGYLFRVWRNETDLSSGYWIDVKELINLYMRTEDVDATIHALAQLDNINAIQAIHQETRKGKMVYTVPF